MASQRETEAEIELGEALPLLQNRAPHRTKTEDKSNILMGLALYLLGGALFLACSGLVLLWSQSPVTNYQSAALLASTAPLPPSVFAPFSTIDPRSLNFSGVVRPDNTPGPAFGSLRDKNLPLPTNSWSQNLMYVFCLLYVLLPHTDIPLYYCIHSFGEKLNGPDNKVDQIPYVVDTAGLSPGVRAHGSTVQANDRTVMTIFEPNDGMAMGAVEDLDKNQKIVPYPAFGRLALTLEWKTNKTHHGGRMRSPIVRGCPYVTMEYTDLSPRVTVQRALAASPVIDGKTGSGAPNLVCGVGKGVFSDKPVTVEREIRLQFDTSDMTWLVFVSRPTEFVCSNSPMPAPDPNAPVLPPGVVPTFPGGAPSALFELKSTSPMSPAGVMRIALVNNCTTGQSPQHCVQGEPRDQTAYEKVIRENAEVYPSGEISSVEFEMWLMGYVIHRCCQY